MAVTEQFPAPAMNTTATLSDIGRNATAALNQKLIGMTEADAIGYLRAELANILAELEAGTGFDRQDDIRAVLAATDAFANSTPERAAANYRRESRARNNRELTAADTVKPGDVVSWWHDTGAFGYEPIYATVLSGNKLLTVKSEFGWIIRRRRGFFTRGLVTGRELADFRSETTNGVRKGYQTT